MTTNVFISSTYAGNQGVRQELANRLHDRRYGVMIAEPISKRPGFVNLVKLDQPNIIEVSDNCLQQLSSAQAVICLLSGSLGSRIQGGNTVFRAKHFELELFSAVLQRKPILLCSVPDFEPDRETLEFIDCVLQSNLTSVVRCTSVSDFIDSALRFCEQVDRGTLSTQRGKIGDLIHTLSIRRAAYRSIRSHRVLLPFLGHITSDESQPDLDAAERAIEDAKQQDDMHLKIARLWIAVRELLPVTPQNAKDERIRHLWDDVLAAWAGAASWYGLHAHLHLGAVAAATGLWHLRESNLSKRTGDKEMPVGAVTSANYSLIQRIPSRIIRHFAFRSLRRFLNTHIELSSSKAENLLIRGSINLRLASPFAARFDFRLALGILEGRHAPVQQIGDAMVHLAMALAVTGHRRESRTLIDEGLGYMRGRVPAGPLLRALRKAIQIEAYPLGDRDRANRFRQEVAQIEKADGYLDQMRHFQLSN